MVHLNANSEVSDVGGAVLVDVPEENYFISVINETSGSDGAVHIEVVTQARSSMTKTVKLISKKYKA